MINTPSDIIPEILSPTDDRIFKLILTHPDAKPALIELVTAITGSNITDVAIRNNELPATDTFEKQERLDLNCTTDTGLQIDIEMHSSRIKESVLGSHKNLIGKCIYYLTDLHSTQSVKGISYDKLARTIQITFCTYTVFNDHNRFIDTFYLRDENGRILTDDISVIFVELSKLSDIINKPVSEMSLIEKWSVFFRYADNNKYKDKINEIVQSQGGISVASSLLQNVSQDEKERAHFRSRRMWESDMENNMIVMKERGLREGMQQGMQQGLQQGMQQGKSEGIAFVASNMKRLGIPFSQIAEATGLEVAEIEKL